MSDTKEKGRERLKVYVHVTNPETGNVRVFGPEDDVPEEARVLITNPDVWTTEPLGAEAPEATGPVPEGGQFPNEAAVRENVGNVSKSELYAMSKDELRQRAENAGIETSDGDTKRELVEAITAR